MSAEVYEPSQDQEYADEDDEDDDDDDDGDFDGGGDGGGGGGGGGATVEAVSGALYRGDQIMSEVDQWTERMKLKALNQAQNQGPKDESRK